MTTRPLIIIGSGPAGLTAAIYTARANLTPLVIEGEPSSTSDQPGGQLMLTTEVENFPGFPEGIMGPELMTRFREQAQRFGAEFLTAKATAIDFSERPFKVWVRDDLYLADAIIVSTGAQSLMLGLESEARLLGHGLSTCATCDGFFFRNQEIAVVGGGDSAIEEASFLTKFASKVYLIHRRDSLRASKIMQERALRNPKVRFIWNSEIAEVKDVTKKRVTAVVLRDTKTGALSEMPIDGLFVAIGHTPPDIVITDLVMPHMNGVEVLRHLQNRGVGAAVATGYRRALLLNSDVAVVMAGDGQMDPADVPSLIEPIVDGRADYVKGNRFAHSEVWQTMPRLRLVGNVVLSLLTRITAGYPRMFDSQCGFTAATRRALLSIDLDGLFPRYGYPNDLLARLWVGRVRVQDVPVRTIYGRTWRSGISLRTAIYPVLFVALRALPWRLWARWRRRQTRVVDPCTSE